VVAWIGNYFIAALKFVNLTRQSRKNLRVLELFIGLALADSGWEKVLSEISKLGEMFLVL
jgi:hypothetical protein